jgi:hypothetical protein
MQTRRFLRPSMFAWVWLAVPALSAQSPVKTIEDGALDKIQLFVGSLDSPTISRSSSVRSTRARRTWERGTRTAWTSSGRAITSRCCRSSSRPRVEDA